MSKCIDNKGIRTFCGKSKCKFHFELSFASFNVLCCNATNNNECDLNGCFCNMKKINCWDKERNNEITPYHVSKGSEKKCFFICNKCGNSWRSRISHITSRLQWCPKCAGKTLKSLEKFISEVNIIHRNKYIYDKTVYVNAKTRLIITCPIHGDFQQIAANHKYGYGCEKCGKERTSVILRLTKDEFIQKAIEIHTSNYSYNNVVYVNANTKIIITCNIHGNFEQTAGLHLTGSGCHKCGKEKVANSQRLSLDKFIQKSKTIHQDKYDYSNVNYIDSITKISIICKLHGVFNITPSLHLYGSGCKLCGYQSAKQIRWLSRDEVISRMVYTHGNLYDYSSVIYEGYRIPVTIICKIHGEFKMDPSHHVRGSGCYSCNTYRSSKVAKEWLSMIQSGLTNTLQTNDSPEGEYHVPHTRYSADGYDPITNTIYEFLGSFWHGDPSWYTPDTINSVTGTTMGHLYQKTLEKKRKYIELGYKYVEIWESKWYRFKKYMHSIQHRVKFKGDH